MIVDAAQQRTVYLETPWPELYADVPAHFVRGEKGLRLQMRNVVRQPASTWTAAPFGIESVALSYSPIELETRSVFEAMAYKMPFQMLCKPFWYLPESLGECPLDPGGAPLAVIRPVLRRVEWDNEARNPLPEYVAEIAGDLKERGFATVVICDLQMGHETLADGKMPPCNLALTHGEMNVRQLLATIRDAAVVVGGVGWIVPAAIALGTPTFIVLGGNGGMNAPERLVDRRMDAETLGFAMPDRFCRCMDMRHTCDKTISNLMAQWRRFSRRLPTVRTRSLRGA